MVGAVSRTRNAKREKEAANAGGAMQLDKKYGNGREVEKYVSIEISTHC